MEAIEKVLDYETRRVIDHEEVYHHDGRKIKEYIVDCAWLLRAFTNCRHEKKDYLDASIEKLPCFKLVLQKFQDTGRATPCNCTTNCPISHRLMEFTGLALNFIFELRNMKIDLALQNLIGTHLVNFFVDRFVTLDPQNENQVILKSDLLPSWVVLSRGTSKAIFRTNTFSTDIIYKKGQ